MKLSCRAQRARIVRSVCLGEDYSTWWGISSLQATADLSRREFLVSGAVLAATASAGQAAASSPPHQASGVKVGEVTATSAVVWTRLTAAAARNADEEARSPVGRPGKEDASPTEARSPKLQGACPGAPGRIRVRYGSKPDLADSKLPPGLRCASTTLPTRSPSRVWPPTPSFITPWRQRTWKENPTGPVGSFRTAGKPDARRTSPSRWSPAKCTRTSTTRMAFTSTRPSRHWARHCRVYWGQRVLRQRTPGRPQPRPGPLPLAVDVQPPRHLELLRTVASYWEKDDHDTVKDDCWPGHKLGDLTFEEGQADLPATSAAGREPLPDLPLGQVPASLADRRAAISVRPTR